MWSGKASVMLGSCPDSIENEIARLEGAGMEPNNMTLSAIRDLLAVINASSLS